VIDYHVRIAPRLLPHLVGRALTLKRYPNGVGEPFFFEKRCPPHAPAWIERAPGSIPYCVMDGLASLVWVANLASLELHPSLTWRRRRMCRRWSRSTSIRVLRRTSSIEDNKHTNKKAAKKPTPTKTSLTTK